MKLDPNRACVLVQERRGWAFLHDLVANPLMALTAYSGPSRRFHDYTSARAWPRPARGS